MVTPQQVNSIKVVVKCDMCSKTFNVGQIELLEKPIEIIGKDKKLILTTYICPKCGFEYIVQADDDKTKELLSYYSRTLSKYRKGIINGIPKQKLTHMYDKMCKTQKRINNIRQNLMNKYQGSYYLVGDQKKELRFSVSTTMKVE